MIAIEAAEGQRCDVREKGPSRLELGAKSDDQKYRQVLKTVDQQVEPFAGCRVDPMGILDDHDNGLSRRESFEQPDQGRQRTRLSRLRVSPTGA